MDPKLLTEWIREVRGGALGADPKVLSFDGHNIGAKSDGKLYSAVCGIARNTSTSVELKIGEYGVKAVMLVLTGNTSLTKLGLANFGSNKITDVGAKAIALALKENETLKSLDLAHNQITDVGAEAIALALKENKTLTSLDLESNQITDVGAEAIMLALTENKTLASLNLNNNQITYVGAKAIALALEFNDTLTSLTIYNNSTVSTDQRVLIDSLLNGNAKALKKMAATAQVVQPSAKSPPSSAAHVSTTVPAVPAATAPRPATTVVAASSLNMKALSVASIVQVLFTLPNFLCF